MSSYTQLVTIIMLLFVSRQNVIAHNAEMSNTYTTLGKYY